MMFRKNMLWPPVIIMTAILFLTGGDVLIGFQLTGSPTMITIPFPESILMGRLFLILAFVWLVPSWVVAKVSRFIKRQFKQTLIGKRLTQKINNVGGK